LLLSAVACGPTDDGVPIGETGGSSTAGTNPGTAGTNPGTAGTPVTTAGTGTGMAGTTGNAGSATAGTSSGGSSAGSAQGGSGGSNSGGSNSGGSNSGGSNSGGSNSGGSGGGAATDCATLKLCDGFEGDAPAAGASPWKKTGTVEVVTDQHHGGTKSLHISAPNTANFSANINTTKTFPAADFWGRAWVRLKGDGGGHQMYIAVNLSGDQLRLMNRLGSDNPQVNFQKSDKFYNTGVKITQETWFCYEWHVTTSAVTIMIDGKATNTGAVPGITGGTSILFGYQRYATGTGAGEIWYDDIALNDTQIGCN
jgi:hypothetical protein